MKKLLRYVLLVLLTPLLWIAYGLFVIFKAARKYPADEGHPGSFPRDHRWYYLPLPSGSARNSDGSPYRIYLKQGNSNKLLVFFSGGGVSWNAYTAARPMGVLKMLLGTDSFYFPGTPTYLELANGGILAAQDARNPFNDWNVILLPYSTGDFHTGNHEFPYTDLKGRPRRLYHWGAQNVKAALESAGRVFGDPEQLLIAGESAGAFGCVAAAPTVAGYFRGCPKVAVYSDSAQLFWPQWEEVLRHVWQADPALADCLHSGGNLILDWFQWLHQQLGDDVVYLQSCSIHDEVLSTFQNKLNHDVFALDGRALAEFNRYLNETIHTLSAHIPSYRYFLSEQDKKEKDGAPEAGATAHTAARYKRFYSKTAQGISLADWLSDAAAGKLYHVGTELLSREESL